MKLGYCITDQCIGQFDRVHNENSLKAFATENISQWYADRPLSIRICPAHGSPPIECQLYEFQPKDMELITQRQGAYDPKTGKTVYRQVKVAPWSFKELTAEDVARFDKYFTILAGNEAYMKAFPAYCFDEQSDDFLARLLKIMVDYKASTRKEVNLVAS